MSDDVRAEIREWEEYLRRLALERATLMAQNKRLRWALETVNGDAKHRIGLLMAENERLRWALETVAFVRHKKAVAGRCPDCRKIAERILAGATIEAALDGAHVPEEEVLR